MSGIIEIHPGSADVSFGNYPPYSPEQLAEFPRAYGRHAPRWLGENEELVQEWRDHGYTHEYDCAGGCGKKLLFGEAQESPKCSDCYYKPV